MRSASGPCPGAAGGVAAGEPPGPGAGPLGLRRPDQAQGWLERRISIRTRRCATAARARRCLRRLQAARGDAARDRVKLIGRVALTAANRPEGEAAFDLFADVERQGLSIATLDVDRAYLLSPPVQWRHGLGLHVNCRAPSAGHGELFDKTRFELDLGRGRLVCPRARSDLRVQGSTVHFDARCAPSARRRRSARRARRGAA